MFIKRHFLWRLSLYLYIVTSLSSAERLWAHGGTPRVLKVIPPSQDADPLWVIDTLGIFRGDSTALSDSKAWSWLCDDAVDPTLGVDDLTILDPTTFIAIAKSGLYRSEDAGCSFQRIESPMNDFALGSLSINPDDDRRQAIYTDSIGQDNGIWTSVDRGLSWERSPLTIEGSIYSLIRNPRLPSELWINHAQGLSVSRDGGQSFESLDTRGYSLEASSYEARLLNVSYIGEQLTLFVAINRFPVASLVISLDRGQTWRTIHQAEDSYEELLVTESDLWISTPFEGLFHYRLEDAERGNETLAWSRGWNHYSDQFVACLRPDPLITSRLWGCGRSSPTDWIMGYTDIPPMLVDSQTLEWRTVMTEYSEAAAGDWGCSPQSASLLACQNRCLSAGCDPSGRDALITPPIDDTQDPYNERDINEESTSQQRESDHSPQEGGGCLQDHHPPLSLPSALLLFCVLIIRRKISVSRAEQSLSRRLDH